MSEVDRIFNYSKTNICKYYIVELYKAFDEYLKNSIEEIFQFNPLLVLELSAAQVSVSAVDIIKLGEYKNICKKIISDIYRKLEDLQSTRKLLDKYKKTFKIEIEKRIEKKALSVLELRHLIIHNDCKIDEVYEKSYPEMKLCAGKKISTTFSFVSTLDSNLTAFIDLIDKILLEKKLIKEN